MAVKSRSGMAVDRVESLAQMRARIHTMLLRKVESDDYDDTKAPGAFNVLAGALYRGKFAPPGLTQDDIVADLVSDFRALIPKS